jgi:hypothetical protein
MQSSKSNTNKSSFRSDALNIHFFHQGMMYNDKYGIMFGPTKGHANPPISRAELKSLADFIYQYLENH